MPKLEYSVVMGALVCQDCGCSAMRNLHDRDSFDCPVCAAVAKERERCRKIARDFNCYYMNRDVIDKAIACSNIEASIVNPGSVSLIHDGPKDFASIRLQPEMPQTIHPQDATGFLVDSFLRKPLEAHLL